MFRFYHLLALLAFSTLTTAETLSVPLSIRVQNKCHKPITINEETVGYGQTRSWELHEKAPLVLQLGTKKVELLYKHQVCARWSQIVPKGWSIAVGDQVFCGLKSPKLGQDDVLLSLSDNQGTCHGRIENINKDDESGDFSSISLDFEI